MTIDLTKLNGVLKTLGELSDSNNNNKIEGKEISVFQGYAENAVKNGVITENEFKAIFGLEETQPSVKSSQKAVTTPVELSKKDLRRNKNSVTESVEKYIKSEISAEDLMTKLKAEYTNPEYSQLLSDVEYVLNLIPEYNSKEDVEKIYKNVKAELKDSDKWNNFTQDILKLLETQAEAIQIGKEFENLKAMYAEVKTTMANTDIVKEKGDNYKAYVEIVKDELQKKGADGKKAWDKSYTKEAFELLQDYAKEDAENIVSSRLALTNQNSSKKIKKELNEANKGKDKYQEEAIKSLEVEREAFARKNTIENRQIELANISREELRKELGNDLFEKLNRAYLGTKVNSQGNYDLSQLSKDIMTRVGIDYQVNYSSDNEMAELTNIKRHLKSTTGIDFTEKEVKKLMELCEIKKQKKDRSLKTAGKEALGNLPGIIGGAITGLALSKRLHVNQNVLIPIDNQDLASNIIKDMEGMGYQPEIQNLAGGKVGIKVSQEVLIDTRILDTLAGAGIGALTSALMVLAFGKEIDEKSCMSISDYDINDEKYTNVEKYKEYIAQTYTNPKKVEAIQVLADTYYTQYGDDWHVHYQQALRDMAGIGSKLNPEECRMMKYHTPDIKEEIPVTEPVPETVPEPCEDCNANIEAKYTDTTYPYERQGGDTWMGIVKAFYPCLEEEYGMFGKDGAIRRLKKALSYNEDGTFNEKTYQALLNGGDLPKTMKLPASIDNCDRVDNAKVKKVKVSGNGKALIQEVGNNSGYTTYTASDDCTNETVTASSKQEALAKLKEKTGKEYTNEAELLK